MKSCTKLLTDLIDPRLRNRFASEDIPALQGLKRVGVCDCHNNDTGGVQSIRSNTTSALFELNCGRQRRLPQLYQEGSTQYKQDRWSCRAYVFRKQTKGMQKKDKKSTK